MISQSVFKTITQRAVTKDKESLYSNFKSLVNEGQTNKCPTNESKLSCLSPIYKSQRRILKSLYFPNILIIQAAMIYYITIEKLNNISEASLIPD